VGRPDDKLRETHQRTAPHGQAHNGFRKLNPSYALRAWHSDINKNKRKTAMETKSGFQIPYDLKPL
jgi:hypothetical protein